MNKVAKRKLLIAHLETSLKAIIRTLQKERQLLPQASREVNKTAKRKLLIAHLETSLKAIIQTLQKEPNLLQQRKARIILHQVMIASLKMIFLIMSRTMIPCSKH